MILYRIWYAHVCMFERLETPKHLGTCVEINLGDEIFSSWTVSCLYPYLNFSLNRWAHVCFRCTRVRCLRSLPCLSGKQMKLHLNSEPLQPSPAAKPMAKPVLSNAGVGIFRLDWFGIMGAKLSGTLPGGLFFGRSLSFRDTSFCENVLCHVMFLWINDV